METPEKPETFKNRRTGLVVFGSLSIAIGALAGCLALFIPVAMLGNRLAPQAEAAAPDPRGLVFAIIFYAAIAALFVWLGIGSIRARRWVRPLMLSVAWTWLLCGVLGLVFWLMILPDLSSAIQAAAGPNEPPLSSEMLRAVSLTASALFFLVYIALPAAFVWFYQDRNVQLTLDRLDPVPRWTDRCPTPVLGLSLGLGLAALSTLTALLYGIVPVFGVILTGIPAVAVILLLAAVLSYLAWATYRLWMSGWWGTVALTVVMLASGALTAIRGDLFEIYRQMGAPAEQIEILRRYSVLNGPVAAILGGLIGLATLAYMVYVRKFFVNESAR